MVKPSKPGPLKAPPAPKSDADRRKYRRVDLPLKGRFLDENGDEQACLVINISAGGAYLRAKNPPAFGQSIVLYVDQMGRFEGKVIRSSAASFAVTYDSKQAKSARTADDLTQVVNRGNRTHDRRITPRIQQECPTRVYFDDGRSEECSILDISLTGASIEISPRPPLGARLILGRMTAKVVRRHEKGVGVVFTGEAARMDDIISEASKTEPAPNLGAPIAKTFGKKG